MKRAQTTFPGWWLDLPISDRQRQQITSKYTITRDGYVRWYAGRTRHVCGTKTPPDRVDEAWDAKKKTIDQAAGETALRATVGNTYRHVLSEFLAGQKARIGAARKPLKERTYHNYVAVLNAFGAFVHNGEKIADLPIRDIGPEHFTAFAKTFAKWKASGFDSVVSRTAALFRYAIEMEYIDRYRPGPAFVRPAKQEIRDNRIDLQKTFAPAEVAKLYETAGPSMRCFIALGIVAAFNNSDIAHLPRSVVDLDKGIIDFRRRKTGKVRRVIPLPPEVSSLLRDYRRPEPAANEWDDLFFLTVNGLPYSRTKSRAGKWMPSDSVSRLFRDRMADAEVEHRRGRNFGGLRTSFYNWCPRGYSDERAIIMGRAKGTIDLDHYLETLGMERLAHVTAHMWELLSTARRDESNPSKP